MAEQRSLSSIIGNYHAHTSPFPSFSLRFVCTVGGFGGAHIKNSQPIPDKNCKGHGIHIAEMISPIVVYCLGILNCFFRSSLPQENPPSE